jgi:hypothetical protein
MSRLPHISQTQARILALGATASVFVLTVWASSNLPQLDRSSGGVDQSNAGAASEPEYPEYEVNVTPAVYRASTTVRCSPWDVSPEAMEVILQEMVRRGWRPPRSDLALASTQPDDGLRIEALYPDERVWVGSPRGTPPAETGDVVDVTVPDAENEGAAATLTPAIPALPTAPASPEPEAPAIPPPPAPPTN